MNLLLLGLNYAPEPVGIGPYTTGLATALAARGHQVSVVAGTPYYPQWKLFEGFSNRRTTAIEDGVAVTRVPHYIPGSPSGPRRILHHMTFAASALAPSLALAGNKPDLVFTVAPSLIAVPVAALAARRAKAPLWLHVQDFEVEAAFATGLLDQTSLAARLGYAVEDWILRRADFASSISPQMCAKLVDKGFAPERVCELRNWSNASFDFGAADPDAYRREWGLGNRKVVLYSGNIANKQGLEIVIEAARWLAHRKDLVFVICGEGPNRPNLEAQAAGLANVQFHDLQPVGRMADFLSLATVHVLPQIVGAADLVLPSKLTNILASGRPVVATADPGTGLHAEVNGCGISTPPGKTKPLAEAIARIADEPDLAAHLGENGRQRAAERWSQAAIVAAMEQRAEALVAQGRRG